MRAKAQCTNEERREAVLEVRAAGEATEALADIYGVHRVTLWRWVRAEDRIKDAQGPSRKKKKISKGVADRFSRTIQYNLEMVNLLSAIKGAKKHVSVFNMDQTSIYIDMGPKSTIEFVGAKKVDAIQGMSENSFRASAFCVPRLRGKSCSILMVNGTIAQKPYSQTRKKAYYDEEHMLEWIDE
ncbi:hypothetical protein L915_01150, partial [Phytophthora nicotianae]